MVTSIDNLDVKNDLGMFRGKKNNEYFLFFQNAWKDPPSFPKPKKVWDKIKEVDQENLTTFLNELEVQKERQQRSKRKERVDPVDVSIKLARAGNKTEKFKRQKVTNIVAPQRANYFESPEAILLFNPMPGETVLECLSRRIELLKTASFDDSCLEQIVASINSLSDLTIKQREILRMQCLCLKQAYESAIQFMNNKTWHDCCQLAVEEVANIGIFSVKDKRTICNWNFEFRNREKLPVSNVNLKENQSCLHCSLNFKKNL